MSTQTDHRTSTAGKGFARSPDIIKAVGGPQMEDYPDWHSWYFARKKWVFERMSAGDKRRRTNLRRKYEN